MTRRGTDFRSGDFTCLREYMGDRYAGWLKPIVKSNCMVDYRLIESRKPGQLLDAQVSDGHRSGAAPAFASLSKAVKSILPDSRGYHRNASLYSSLGIISFRARTSFHHKP